MNQRLFWTFPNIFKLIILIVPYFFSDTTERYDCLSSISSIPKVRIVSSLVAHSLVLPACLLFMLLFSSDQPTNQPNKTSNNKTITSFLFEQNLSCFLLSPISIPSLLLSSDYRQSMYASYLIHSFIFFHPLRSVFFFIVSFIVSLYNFN